MDSLPQSQKAPGFAYERSQRCGEFAVDAALWKAAWTLPGAKAFRKPMEAAPRVPAQSKGPVFPHAPIGKQKGAMRGFQRPCMVPSSLTAAAVPLRQLIRLPTTTRRPLSRVYSQVDRHTSLSPYSAVRPVS